MHSSFLRNFLDYIFLTASKGTHECYRSTQRCWCCHAFLLQMNANLKKEKRQIHAGPAGYLAQKKKISMREHRPQREKKKILSS